MKKSTALLGLLCLLCGLAFGSSPRLNQKQQTERSRNVLSGINKAPTDGVNLKWTFDEEASFTADWATDALSGSEITRWKWADKSTDEEGHGGLCMVDVDQSLKTDIDEWLYLRNKVTLKAGKAIVRFQRKLASWELPTLTVYYGETYTSQNEDLTSIKSMVADMSSVAQWQTWQQEEIEFDVATDGDYIIVFSLYMEGVGESSSSYSGAPFYLDNIEIVQESGTESKILEVPLSFTFDDEASFTADWSAMTSDADGTTWTWQTASWNTPSASEGSTGYVGTGDNATTAFPKDYLFMKNPVKLSAGKATFGFDWYSMSWSSTDDAGLKVFYSKKVSMEESDLTEIVSIRCDEYEEWQTKQVEFEVPEDGNYYFCIYYYMMSEWNDQELIFIDNVEINQEAAPLEVPLSFTFDDEASFTADWSAMTSDADGTTWTWQTASWNTPSASEGSTGYVGTGDNATTAFPKDYLFMKNPVKLSAGKATFGFDWYSMSWSSTDDAGLKVFYSKKVSMEESDLTEIASIRCDEYEEWQTKQVEFEVPEDGNYYFCIYYYMMSEWNAQELIFIDNVEINQEAAGSENRLDLVLDELILPESSMTLGNAEEIGVKVTNKGTVEITKITLTYAINEGTPVEQVFEETLAVNASQTLTFTQKADFSAAGAYTVVVKVKSVEANTEAEENPEGDSIGGRVRHLAPQTLPYSCTFETAEEFAEQWNTFSRSDDGAEDWAWFDTLEHFQTPTGSFSGSGGFAASRNSVSVNGKTANYLITAVPFVLSADGPVSIEFQYRRAYGTSPVGSLQVYYGSTAEVGENQEGMTLIGNVTVPDGTAWHEGGLEFNVTESGEYYLFFKHEAEKTAGSYFVLDNLNVKEGAFVGTPDIVVNSVELPLSSCALGDAEPIVVEVENRGTATITKFRMSYTVNDGTAVEQEFSDTLAPETKKRLTFNTKADFSTKAQYVVNVTAEILENNGNPEASTDNNSASASVAYRMPATLPFEADFTKNADERNKMAFTPGTWAYDAPRQGMTTNEAAVLQSPCLPFEADATYRIQLIYRGYLKTVDFDVLCGLATEPMANWRTLKVYKNVNTEGQYQTDVLEFHSGDIAGDYAVAVMPRDPENGTYTGGLYVQSVKIDRKPDYDIRITAIHSTLGTQTPVQHIISPKFEILLKNYGEKNGTNITVTVKNGQTLVGKSEPMSIATGDSSYCTFSGQLSLESVGEVGLRVEAVLEGVAENQPENVREWTFTATREDYAFDNVSLTSYTQSSVGIRNTPVGHVFTLAVQDTLTAVVLGWEDLSGEAGVEADKVRVEVYPVNESDKTGECLLAYETERPVAGGVHTVNLPSRILPAGRYFIGVRQLNPIRSMALGCDNNPEGVFYLVEDGAVETQDGFGYVAVRAKFSPNPLVVEKDIEMLAIGKPGERGVYAANEPIVAEYRNNGCEAMEVEFRCTVSGTTTSKTVTVAAYGTGIVEFEADMARPGSYGILVEAVAEGDENADNNRIRKTVTCVEVDPYVMDFELCEDFTLNNLLPWRTVDGDNTRTTGLDGYKWPHYGEPMGFMAFNPAEVSMQEITPANSGDRFGMAIASVGVRNDDWLVSPRLKMPAQNASVSYYVRSYHQAYTETYEVLVSTIDSALASFVKVGETRTATDTWTENKVDLSEYNGQEIFIAFRYTANDQFFFMIDDIEVSKPGVGVEVGQDLSDIIRSYPNPVSDVWTVTAYGANIKRVVLYNTTGHVVWSSASTLNTESLRLDMHRFAAGLYTAHVYTDAGVQVMKVIVR